MSYRPHPEMELHQFLHYQPACIIAIVDAYKQDIMLVNYYKDDQVMLHNEVLGEEKKSNIASGRLTLTKEKVIQDLQFSLLCGHS
jgi:hypothetical protein